MTAIENTSDHIQTEFKSAYAELLAKYGDHNSIPKDEVAYISEVMRARHVLRANPGETNVPQLLKRYAVATAVITLLTGEDAANLTFDKPVKRADKYAKITEWAEQNAGATTTIYELAEIGEVSYPTANKFVKDRPDLFHRVKKGSYLVRNPAAERAADKG